MAGRKQTEINRRRQLVSKLRHEGVRSQQSIADRLRDDYGIDVDRSTISLDLKALNKQWQASALADTDKWKNEVIDQYNYLYQQAIVAWEMSLEDAEETTISEDGVTTKVKGQSGNPSHLRNAQDALKAVRDVIGLDASGKLDIKLEIEIEKFLNHLQDKLDPDTYDKVIEAIVND